MGTVNEHGHECWIVETSKDGERWRFFGRAWKRPGEEVLLHAVPRYVRFRPEWEKEWREPLERTSDLPMTLLLMEAGARSELWPDADHVGLPMLLTIAYSTAGLARSTIKVEPPRNFCGCDDPSTSISRDCVSATTICGL